MTPLRLTFERTNAPDLRMRWPKTEYVSNRKTLSLRFSEYEELQPGRELWNETKLVDCASGKVHWSTHRPARLISDYRPWSAGDEYVVIAGELSVVLHVATNEEHPLDGDIWFAEYSPNGDRLLCRSKHAVLHRIDGTPLAAFPKHQALGWTRGNRFLLSGPNAEIALHDASNGELISSAHVEALSLFPIDADTRVFMESAPVTITSSLAPRKARDLVNFLTFLIDEQSGDLLVAAVRPTSRDVRISGNVRSIAGEALWLRSKIV